MRNFIIHRAREQKEGRRRPLQAPWFVAAAVAVLATACDNPLNTVDPDIVLPGNLEGPEAISTLVQGAVGDFSLAYAGDGTAIGIVMNGGLLSDEWVHSGTFSDRVEIDTRTINTSNAGLETVFRNLQRARRAAEKAAEFIQVNAEDPDSDARLGRMFNLAGYTYLFSAENFCSGVPFSSANDDGTLDFGEPLTTTQIYDVAVERFGSGRQAAQSASSSEQTSLADLGMARALLGKGDLAGAASAAANVPTGFSLQLEHSLNTPREENGIYFVNVVDERWSIGDGEGINGLSFLGLGGAVDIRVPWIRTGGGTDVGFDRGTAQFDLLKYPGSDEASIVAVGVEARLIEAEVALAGGNAATWLQLLNDLRASVATLLTREHLDVLRDQFGIKASDVSLDPLADPGTPDARVDLHFSERGFWLYATGQRLSDLRRLVRQYGRSAESVFPTGSYFKAGFYGTDVNFPLPADEVNNPTFAACIDRGA